MNHKIAAAANALVEYDAIGYAANADRYEDWRANRLPLRDSQQPFNNGFKGCWRVIRQKRLHFF